MIPSPSRCHDKEGVDISGGHKVQEGYIPVQQREGHAQALRALQRRGAAVVDDGDYED